eukprot:scaffold38203_cov32-Tisochrysis_lutea.AAC.4
MWAGKHTDSQSLIKQTASLMLSLGFPLPLAVSTCTPPAAEVPQKPAASQAAGWSRRLPHVLAATSCDAEP